MAESFTSDFKRFFGRGLAILLPTAVTLWLLWQAFGFIYSTVAQPINSATRLSVLWVVPKAFDEDKLPEWFNVTPEELIEARTSLDTRDADISDAALKRELRAGYLTDFWEDHWYLNLTGLFIAIMLIYLAGVLLGNFVGRSLYQTVERLITQIPGFKQVYPHVKQVVDLILGDRKLAFSKVVLAEYPSKGIWTIGFLTGHSVRDIDQHAGGTVVSVFIPTSPTPFTGFTINVRKDTLVEMDMTMEEALRFVITAGVLTPDSPKPGEILPESIHGPIAKADPDTEPGTTPKHG